MDELFELMNDDDDVDRSSSNNNSSSSSNSEIRHHEPQNNNSISTDTSPYQNSSSSSSSRSRSSKKKQDTTLQQQQQQQQQQQVRAGTASIDDQLGVRMTHRFVSSSELSELVHDYMYYSPSVFSALPLQRRNQLLQDPSPILDPVTVTGKLVENFVTVGIVFHNSGTRISAKKNAFCVVTLGSNLHAGPSVSIFLFGNAYGKFCTSCTPGKVIALMGAPKLLPANNNNDNRRGSNNKNKSNRNTDHHAVSLSVYDVNQIQIIATARDYGTCKSASCKQYIDKRISDYCDYHRRREAGGGGTNNNNNLNTKFQQIKSQHQQHQAILVPQASRTKRHLNTNANNNNKTNTNRFLNNNNHRPTMTTNGITTTRLFTNNSSNNEYSSQQMTGFESRSRIGRNSAIASSASISSNGRFGRNRKNEISSTTRIIPKAMSKIRSSSQQQQNSNTTIIHNGRRSSTTTNGTTCSNAVQNLAAKRQRVASVDGGNWMEEAIAISKKNGGGPPPISSIGNSNRRGFSLATFTTKSNNNKTNDKQLRVQHQIRSSSKVTATATANTTTSIAASDTIATNSSNHNHNHKQAPRSINTTGLRFDGSVCIPKASSLFQLSNTATTATAEDYYLTSTSNSRIVTPTNNQLKETTAEHLLQQQSLIAHRVKEGRKGTNNATSTSDGKEVGKRGRFYRATERKESHPYSNTKTTSTKIKSGLNPYSKRNNNNTKSFNSNNTNTNNQSNNNSKSKRKDDVNDFLTAMGGDTNFDEEKIRQAKSRFANEAAADDYAKQRRKVVELEKLEESQNKKKSSKDHHNNKHNNRITKTWYCKSCQQQYNYKPNNCIAARHDIKTRHEIKSLTTKDEQRTKMHRQSTDDGGLILGSGLDWSRNKFNN